MRERSKGCLITDVPYSLQVKGQSVSEILEIEIKPGWKLGTKITFQEKGRFYPCALPFHTFDDLSFTSLSGDERPGVIPADIVFVIGEKPHPTFRRDGNDLIHTVRLSLADALCGTTLSIQHLDGTTLSVPVTEVITPSSCKVIRQAFRAVGLRSAYFHLANAACTCTRGKGMPVAKTPGSFGNLVFKFEVAFPRTLSSEQKEKIREVLGA